jgi:hypothetical protein
VITYGKRNGRLAYASVSSDDDAGSMTTPDPSFDLVYYLVYVGFTTEEVGWWATWLAKWA